MQSRHVHERVASIGNASGPPRTKTGLDSISAQPENLAALKWSQFVLAHLKMQTMWQITGQYTFNLALLAKEPLTSASR